MADKPLPTNEGELNIFMQALVAKVPTYSATLGLTAGEVDALNDDAANFEYIIEAAALVTDSKDAFFSFKRELIDGVPSTTQLAIPTFPAISTPEHPFPGIMKRLRALIQRIKTSPGYTQQIGEDLGLVDSGDAPLSPDDLTAEFSNVKALSDSRVEISFSKQGQDAMKVLFKRNADSKFNLAGIYTSSPAIHDEGPIDSDTPESRQYKGVLMKKNEEIGNESPIYTVVTTP